MGQGVCLPGGVSVEWCVRTWVYVSTWEGVCGVVCANLGVCVYLGGGVSVGCQGNAMLMGVVSAAEQLLWQVSRSQDHSPYGKEASRPDHLSVAHL